jgi:hypothetical protein
MISSIFHNISKLQFFADFRLLQRRFFKKLRKYERIEARLYWSKTPKERAHLTLIFEQYYFLSTRWTKQNISSKWRFCIISERKFKLFFSFKYIWLLGNKSMANLICFQMLLPIFLSFKYCDWIQNAVLASCSLLNMFLFVCYTGMLRLVSEILPRIKSAKQCDVTVKICIS